MLCEISFINGVPLNEANQDLQVNFLQYGEYGPDGAERHWSWVTDLEISRQNAPWLVKGGRCRWKIENETFNTLKNQGYHFEHNFGHGEKNLSVVFAMSMMLAFLVDQVQQLCCPLFQAVWKKVGTKRALWERLRSHFWHFLFQSMQHLYQVVLYDLAKNLPAPTLNTGQAACAAARSPSSAHTPIARLTLRARRIPTRKSSPDPYHAASPTVSSLKTVVPIRLTSPVFSSHTLLFVNSSADCRSELASAGIPGPPSQ